MAYTSQCHHERTAHVFRVSSVYAVGGSVEMKKGILQERFFVGIRGRCQNTQLMLTSNKVRVARIQPFRQGYCHGGRVCLPETKCESNRAKGWGTCTDRKGKGRRKNKPSSLSFSGRTRVQQLRSDTWKAFVTRRPVHAGICNRTHDS